MAKRECVAAALPAANYRTPTLLTSSGGGAKLGAPHEAFPLARPDQSTVSEGSASSACRDAMFVLIVVSTCLSSTLSCQFSASASSYSLRRLSPYKKKKKMNATRWKDAGRELGKRARSRGSRGNEIGTKRRRIEEKTRELSREFETCRKFITKNLSFRDALEREIRQLVTLRETMQSRFKKWRHNLGCARERLARFEAELLDDDEGSDDEDENVNIDIAIERIADEWDRLDEIVEETMEEGIELERRVRLLTTTVLQLERYLMSRKMEHESLHVRLCEKLVSIMRSRRCVTAKLYEIARTKNGTRECVDRS